MRVAPALIMSITTKQRMEASKEMVQFTLNLGRQEGLEMRPSNPAERLRSP